MTDSMFFGPHSYRMQYQGRAYRIEWESEPQPGETVREPFRQELFVVDGVDSAGMILATNADGYQSASAPWDLEFVEECHG